MFVQESGCGYQTAHTPMTTEWEELQCPSMALNGGPATDIWVLDVWKSLMLHCGPLDSARGDSSEERITTRARSQNGGSL